MAFDRPPAKRTKPATPSTFSNSSKASTACTSPRNSKSGPRPPQKPSHPDRGQRRGRIHEFGYRPDQLLVDLPQLNAFRRLEIRGLMCMAPYAPDPETVRPVFGAATSSPAIANPSWRPFNRFEHGHERRLRGRHRRRRHLGARRLGAVWRPATPNRGGKRRERLSRRCFRCRCPLPSPKVFPHA